MRETALALTRGSPPVSGTHETPLDETALEASKPLPKGIVRDAKYPNMYRLRLPDGTLSDMVNLRRAKDALRTRGGLTPIPFWRKWSFGTQ
jgi:hypothetical protein